MYGDQYETLNQTVDIYQENVAQPVFRYNHSVADYGLSQYTTVNLALTGVPRQTKNVQKTANRPTSINYPLRVEIFSLSLAL